MLEVENLTVSVEGKTLLKDISLHIEEGETRMLFGENGSGKTSLLMAIMGLGNYQVESGRILFKGVDITGLPTHERARMGIGIMFQRPPTIRGLKVEEMLDLIKRDGRDPEELAAELNFTDFLDRDLNLGFSGGEIKRAELLQLMAQDPDLVLLDEPMTGLDPVGRVEVKRIIEELHARGKTVMFNSHILSDVHELCSRIAIMRSGRVIWQGTVDEALDEAPSLEDFFMKVVTS